jgi:AcrR family transcriptional regulator
VQDDPVTERDDPSTPAAHVGDDAAKTARGEETRAKIVEAALGLFRERGYDDTTMRAVAERAGVSLGNAYYYFASKEHLLQGYYARMKSEHETAAEPVLARERDLKARLLGVINAHLDVSEPYHRFAGLLFRTAADPKSPLSPFSKESEPARKESIRLYERVLEGAAKRIPDDLRVRLPELLWTFSMGIVLFWVHDDSPGRAKTRALAARSVDLVVRLISLASNPLLRPLRRQVVSLLDEVAAAGVSSRPS